MLVDARHSEGVRVAILSTQEGKLLDYDLETPGRKVFKGNIYLAKVVRIEPSLQAAFVEYGGDRHGFLPFSDIHPDYFKASLTDEHRELLKQAGQPAAEKEGEEHPEKLPEVEEEDDANISLFRKERLYRQYKIQEVIKKGQVLLVQVAREERGEKGAALTTYLALAGRYCVLMPNAGRAGGVSRKINDHGDRQRLRKILEGIEVPEGMGLIIRTAGLDRSKLDIKKDLDYLVRIWTKIRELTLASVAPQLIHTEGSILQRTIRDSYGKDVEEILIEGAEAFETTRTFMKILIPAHVKKVKQYEDASNPLFQKLGVEEQIQSLYEPKAPLKSGGYLVINPTEALVSIDVNSGRSTKERSIDDTALRTNLEAAVEAARQMRLRDLAGLIVIDFIDMDNAECNEQVEKAFKEALQSDRARVQVGKISEFGLLELSRQRLRPSFFELSSVVCDHCRGTGFIRDNWSLAMQSYRLLENAVIRAKEGDRFELMLPISAAYVLFNDKKKEISDLESMYKVAIDLRISEKMVGAEFKLSMNQKEIKSFKRVQKKIEDVVRTDASHVAKLKPTELYDLEDESLKESYSEQPKVEGAEHGQGRFGRRHNDRRRNRRFNKDRKGGFRPDAPAEKKSWWGRLWS